MDFLDTDNSIWQSLFQKFRVLIHLAPWDWFGEHDSFIIHPQGYPQPFFVHTADRVYEPKKGFVIVYGWNGEARFRQIERGTSHPLTASYEVPLVLCAMRETSALTDLERNTLNIAEPVPSPFAKLCKNESPIFVSFRPGWLPWHLSKDETLSTLQVLSQTLGVLLRAESNPSLFKAPAPAIVWARHEEVLQELSLTNKKPQKTTWIEGWAKVPPYIPPWLNSQLEISHQSLENAAKLPDDMPPIEFAFDVVPKIALLNIDSVTLRGEDNRIPLGYFFAICPYCNTIVPQKQIENGVYYPGNNLDSLRNFLCNVLVKFFLRKGHRPKEIIVSSTDMMEILRPLQLEIPFKMIFHEHLPNYEHLLDLVLKSTSKQ